MRYSYYIVVTLDKIIDCRKYNDMQNMFKHKGMKVFAHYNDLIWMSQW
jgi:hypothetical protein